MRYLADFTYFTYMYSCVSKYTNDIDGKERGREREEISFSSAGLRSSVLVQSEQERRGHHARWDSGAKRRGT